MCGYVNVELLSKKIRFCTEEKLHISVTVVPGCALCQLDNLTIHSEKTSTDLVSRSC